MQKRSLWAILRYPLGILAIGLLLFAKAGPQAIPYKNAAQAGGASIANIILFWGLFYMFISRKNGIWLNSLGPIFGFGMAYLAHDIRKGYAHEKPVNNSTMPPAIVINK